MKIIYKQGNLLDCKEKIIVHGCNAQGKMGAGVAMAIRKKYPRAYEEYKRFCKRHMPHFMGGDVQFVDCGEKIIVNAMTQHYYGREKKRYVSYTAVRLAMSNINNEFIYHNQFTEEQLGDSIAMPKIGAGLAGGDWNIIEKIIEEECTDVQPVVYYL